MKEQSKIPTSKISRASKFVTTGAKIGGNYLKHYSKRMVNKNLDRSQLDQDNAKDVYNSLSELKGSALKVAQMLSMDKNMLPKAYQQQFALGQYTAPPLSYPLVVKTFQKSFGKAPEAIFDTFSKQAVNAASIGQVHKATIGEKVFAVKIQYPGVAHSVSSDLKMVKPIAKRMLNLNETELDQYMQEVHDKLIEETDYSLEVARSKSISSACAHIKGLDFATYYSELSSDRIITMDWLKGQHLNEFLQSNPNNEIRNRLGQAMWDFYHHQIHSLYEVHADPHPGNFLMQENGTLGIIDFGCVKVIPTSFHKDYFQLMNLKVVHDDAAFHDLITRLGFIYPDDSKEEVDLFTGLFKEMALLLGKPFHTAVFDFSDTSYFQEIYSLSERLSKMKAIRESKHARGAKDALYINRTYFGLYSILHELGSTVSTSKPNW